MKYFTLIWIVAVSIMEIKAQLFGKKDICIQQGIMNFHAGILNNKSNTNRKISWVSEVDRNLNIARFSSFNYGMGLGNFKNPDTLFRAYNNSNFFRLKFALLIHLPQHHSPKNWSPNFFNPFVKVGYNLDVLDHNYGETTKSRLSTSLKLGAGAVIKISHAIGILYEFSHNQRVSHDYRSFLQQNIGLIINMDTPYLEK